MTWQILATRLLTGQLLDNDLELADSTLSRELNGPGGVFGTIPQELLYDKAPDGFPIIEPWATALYVVEDGVIRTGGIVQQIETEGTTRQITCPGFTSYLEGQRYVGNYNFVPMSWQDPVLIYSNFWEHLQSQPYGNIGVSVEGAPTYVRIALDDKTPYYFMQPDVKIIGDEADAILAAAKIDYMEAHHFQPDGSIRHRIALGFPRLGRQRNDLMFVQGENVVAISSRLVDGSSYSNDVWAQGNGEGWEMFSNGMIQGATSFDGIHVRRSMLVQDSSMSTPGLVYRRAYDELATRSLRADITDFTVRDSPVAPIDSLSVGDDVLLDYDQPYEGQVRVWVRIMAINQAAEAPGQATVQVARSELFEYMPLENPTPGKDFLVTV